MTDNSHVVMSHEPEVLNRIVEDGITLAVWERTLDPELTSFLDDTPFNLIPETRLSAPADVLGSCIERHIANGTNQWGLERLTIDVKMCAERFVKASGARECAVMFDRTYEKGSSNFHDDGLSYRMLVVYRGRDFQWMPESAVERNTGQLPHLARWVIRDLSAVRAVTRGQVAILKGTAGKQNGLIHRAESGTDASVRFRLRIDEVSEGRIW